MAVTSLMDDPLDPFEAIIVFYFLTRSSDPLLSSDNTVWVAFTSFVVLNGLPQLFIYFVLWVDNYQSILGI